VCRVRLCSHPRQSGDVQRPVVISDEDAVAEASRLGQQLGAVRRAAGYTTRAVAAAAGVNLGTLWRLETGRNAASMYKFGSLAKALRHRIELDDGSDRPRMPLAERALWPPGWAGAGPPDLQPSLRNAYEQLRLGAELFWIRRHLLGLTDEAVCELLGMSHHTLRAVEFGPRWPYLTSVIRVVALSGRRLELAPDRVPPRLPPWLPLDQPDAIV
jgi:transcriptional regulator with XRE-family HTH domain